MSGHGGGLFPDCYGWQATVAARPPGSTFGIRLSESMTSPTRARPARRPRARSATPGRGQTLTAVLAEKPSVARDLARALGANERGDGCLRGNGYVVTWAVGHLARLAEPGEIDPAWSKWRADRLPMLPKRWPLVVEERTRGQFVVVRRVLLDPAVERVVCATDAGREGELIFRYVYECCGCSKPVSRLWISSLTSEAIRAGFARLRDGAELEPLADAARGRARADWLVGMNLSRACSLAHDDSLSVGRVQTPTLALIVDRENAISTFVAETYFEVRATFQPERLPHGSAGSFEGSYIREPGGPVHRFRGGPKGDDAARLEAESAARTVAERAATGRARVETATRRSQRTPPPQLYDLTELQRHANRLYGFTARRTLQTAQSLYERRKRITYPRTDSRHLPSDLVPQLLGIVERVAEPYREHLRPGTGEDHPGPRFVDDAKVTDHHAILPTAVDAPRGGDLEPDEAKIYDLVCRRFLAMWQGDHVAAVSTVVVAVDSGPGRIPGERGESGDSGESVVDLFLAKGIEVEQVGWKALDITPERGRKTPKPGRRGGDAQPSGGDSASEPDDPRDDNDPGDDRQKLPPGLTAGAPAVVLSAVALEKETRPPPRLTDGTLLTAMETAGRSLTDRELSEAMKERGLGTPATRAETLETLVRREYVVRRGKALVATAKGISLIARVHPEVKSPAMTGEWEAQLRAIERGALDLGGFLERIEDFVRRLTAWTLEGRAGDCDPASPQPANDVARARPERAPPVHTLGVPATQTLRTRDPGQLLSEVFGFDGYRPFQEVVCQAVIAGDDALLVMPTGAGKSLCYQLPGLVRGGTTLVVSPLIALMEDQTLKLQGLGLRAERIHSGRPRDESRRVCRQYLEGALDFLFIAPERLGVAGFPELLARRLPVLVAIDEAHCISQWGHDFRPDYRLLGERLPQLRPAPILALTATATPRVQDDIVEQLGQTRARRFIHGFRRQNLAIEVVERRPSQRPEVVEEVLGPGDRRPAIVYAPTRKESESLARRLSERFAAAPYHAGLPAKRRDEIQQRFLGGELEVVVATIAFGMGVDKPDVRTVIHTGLPSTLEGYYQEIGRAGRDGLPSRALLLYSWADRRTHEYFHGRDYPDVEVLDGIATLVRKRGAMTSDVLRRRLGLEDDVFESALDKLWVHGGVVLGSGGEVGLGVVAWRESYLAQRQHRLDQLADITRFAQSQGCRMLAVVRHFGDTDDPGDPCGQCDICRPGDSLAHGFRAPEAEELTALQEILRLLREGGGQGTGRLYKSVFEVCGWLDRGEFEELLSGLARGGLVEVSDASFERDGERIHYRRAELRPAGRRAGPDLEGLVAVADHPVAARWAKTTKRQRSAGKRSAASSRRRPLEDAVDAGVADPALVERLRQWRLEESRRRGVPAFRILTNRTLLAVAAARPTDQEELLAVAGVGPALTRRYGRDLLAICSGGDV